MSSNPHEAPVMELRLFGQPSVLVLGEDVTRSLPKKAVQLLGILALREGKPIDRSQLAGMLWPDVSDAAALHNLRQMLSGIRRALGITKDLIQSPTPRSISLEVSPKTKVDVREFDLACGSTEIHELERAISIYEHPLLHGCEEPFALAARETWQQKFLMAAHKLADQYRKSKDHPAATGMYRRILSEDPYSESACRGLMSELAATRRSVAALEFYREFRSRFRKDLRVDVSGETKDLYRSISKNAVEGAQPAGPKSSLPTPVTDLVGRQSAIADVSALMRLGRLVTLAGAGGVGKTRLAIAIANELSSAYLDGAHFVDLAPLQDGKTIPMAIAGALNVRETPAKTMTDALTEHLADREMLVILDNCEHLARDVVHVIRPLLHTVSGLRVLATSRQTLGLRGELVWSVPALQVPTPTDSPSDILKTEAVRLFLNRSRRRIDESKQKDVAAVASICRRLDGLPLAIELAAARTNVFSPVEIERRLDDRFSLLAAESEALERHQTLLACMDWSWDLLSHTERELLMSLSVFRGGASLRAIENVADDGIGNVALLLGSLIDKSLVTVSELNDQTRYSLLETVREFAQQKLQESGKWQTANDRHRDYFLEWVEEGYRPMNSIEEAKKFAAFELEHDNLRAAIAWCHRKDERAEAVSMCAALSRFWDTCGHLNEGRAQLEFALSHEAPGLSEEMYSRALVQLAWMATVQGECDVAVKNYKLALRIVEKRGDRHARGVILNCLANAYIAGDVLDKAREVLVEALEIAREVKEVSIGMILCNLAEVAFNARNLAEASRWLAEASACIGEPSLERATQGGTFFRHTAYYRFMDGDFAATRTYALKALKFYDHGKILFEIPFALLTLALGEGGSGDWRRAVSLYAAAQKLMESDGTFCPKYLSLARRHSLEEAKKHLPDSEFEAALQSGRLMDLAAAVAFAFNQTDKEIPPKAPECL